jgi:hypothetical protein
MEMVKMTEIPNKLATFLAVPWLRRLDTGFSPRRPGSVHMGFVVDNVALEQVFLLVIRFFPVSVIPPWLFVLKYHLGYEQ